MVGEHVSYMVKLWLNLAARKTLPEICRKRTVFDRHLDKGRGVSCTLLNAYWILRQQSLLYTTPPSFDCAGRKDSSIDQHALSSKH